VGEKGQVKGRGRKAGERWQHQIALMTYIVKRVNYVVLFEAHAKREGGGCGPARGSFGTEKKPHEKPVCEHKIGERERGKEKGEIGSDFGGELTTVVRGTHRVLISEWCETILFGGHRAQ